MMFVTSKHVFEIKKCHHFLKEKKKAAAAAIPGRVKSELASEEDEYVVEQL